jgi:hypothetical protein
VVIFPNRPWDGGIGGPSGNTKYSQSGRLINHAPLYTPHTPADVSDILDDVIALSMLGESAVGLAGLVAEQAAHAREAGQVVRLHVAFHGAPVPVLEGTHAAEEDTTYSTRGCSLFLNPSYRYFAGINLL